MSFSYQGDPSASRLDAVRFLCRDTVDEGHLVEDEEITWMLSQTDGPYSAAAEIADSIALKYSGQASVRFGPSSVSYGERATTFTAMAKDLRMRAMLREAQIIAPEDKAVPIAISVPDSLAATLCAVSGTLVTEEGEPATNVEIIFTPAAKFPVTVGATILSTAPVRVTTDSDGAFEIALVRAASMTVTEAGDSTQYRITCETGNLNGRLITVPDAATANIATLL